MSNKHNRGDIARQMANSTPRPTEAPATNSSAAAVAEPPASETTMPAGMMGADGIEDEIAATTGNDQDAESQLRAIFGQPRFYAAAKDKVWLSDDKRRASRDLIDVLIPLCVNGRATKMFTRAKIRAEWDTAAPEQVDTTLSLPNQGRFTSGFVTDDELHKLAFGVLRAEWLDKGIAWYVEQVKKGAIKATTKARGNLMPAAALGLNAANQTAK